MATHRNPGQFGPLALALMLLAISINSASTVLGISDHPGVITDLGRVSGLVPTIFLTPAADRANDLDLLSGSSQGPGIGHVASTLDLVTDHRLPGAGQPAVQDLPETDVFDSENGQIYVRGASGDAISAVDGATDLVVADIPAPASHLTGPIVPTIVNDSATGDVYAANANTGNISIIDGSDDRIIGSIAVGGSPNGLTLDTDNGYLYVANFGGNNVTVISTGTNQVVANISVGAGPAAILYNLINQEVYVANYDSQNVSVIDTESNRVVASLAVGSDPTVLALDTHDDYVDVANSNNGGQGNVSVIDGATNTVRATAGVGTDPDALAYAPFQNEMFVANGGSDNVTIIDQGTSRPIGSIPIGQGPNAAVYDSDSLELYVSCETTGNVSVILPASGSVVETVATTDAPSDLVVDGANGNVFAVNMGSTVVGSNLTVLLTASNTVGVSIPLNVYPLGITYDPRDGDLYVANSGGNDAYILNATSGLVTTIVPVGVRPQASAYDDINGDVYVVDTGASAVSAIDPAHTLVATIPTGPMPDSIAFDSANGDLYVADDSDGNVSVIDGATNLELTQIPIGPNSTLDAVLYDPHNEQVYVADASGANVTAISSANNTKLRSIPVGTDPTSLAFDSHNDTIFVGNEGSGNVSVIADASNLVAENFVVIDPGVLAYDRGSDTLYNAMHLADKVNGVNATTYETEGSMLSLGSNQEASGVAFDPANGLVYVTTEYADSVSTISPFESYPILCEETGLPPSAAWQMILGGIGNDSSDRFIGFSEPNGTYSYSVAPVTGYTANVTSGQITIHGSPGTIWIGFSKSMPPTDYPVTFDEMGLSDSTNWSVTLAQAREYSSTSSIEFHQSNGSYLFSVAAVPGYEANRTDGSITVSGLPLEIRVSFLETSPSSYSVTFEEVGLPRASNWSVTLAQQSENSTTTSIAFVEPSGEYGFTIGSVTGFSASPSSSVLMVEGASTTTIIHFAPGPGVLTLALLAEPAQFTLGGSTTLGLTTDDGTPPFRYQFSNLPPGCVGLNASWLTCTPAESGNFRVLANVTDDRGESANASATVVVQPIATGAEPSAESPGVPLWEWAVGGVATVLVVAVVGWLLSSRAPKKPYPPISTRREAPPPTPRS